MDVWRRGEDNTNNDNDADHHDETPSSSRSKKVGRTRTDPPVNTTADDGGGKQQQQQQKPLYSRIFSWILRPSFSFSKTTTPRTDDGDGIIAGKEAKNSSAPSLEANKKRRRNDQEEVNDLSATKARRAVDEDKKGLQAVGDGTTSGDEQQKEVDSGDKKQRDPFAFEPYFGLSDRDVLLGPTTAFQKWPGNIRLCRIADALAENFAAGNAVGKVPLVNALVRKIQEDGKFLQEAKTKTKWVEVEDSVAREKVEDILNAAVRKQRPAQSSANSKSRGDSKRARVG